MGDCVFPFEYKGVSYDSCTTLDNGDTPWCSKTAKYSGSWAECPAGKSTKIMINSCIYNEIKNIAI